MIGRRQPPSKGSGGAAEPAPRGFDDFDLRLGDVMRGERATLGKSLLDVQRDLKIKASYIAAIENCDVGAFETPGFIAGYVRSYARYLGMDPEWAFARFCTEAEFVPLDGLSASGRRGPAADRPLPKRGTGAAMGVGLGGARFAVADEPWFGRLNPGALGSATVLLGLIAGLGYGGWLVLQEVQRVTLAPVDAVPGVMADLDPLDRAGVAAPGPEMAEMAGGPGLQAPAPDLMDRMYRPQALDVPVMVARDGPIAAIDPRASGALAGEAREAEAVDAVAAAVAESLAALQAAGDGGDTAPRVQVSEAGPPVVELLAVRPAWVRVSAADGSVLFERILDAGERYTVPALEVAPVLRAGNSGAVYFVVDGQTFGPAAPGANIASNVALSAESLRDSFALADLSRDADLARIVDVAEVAAD